MKGKVWDVTPPKKELDPEEKMTQWLKRKRLEPKPQLPESNFGTKALMGPRKFYEGPLTNDNNET